MANRDQASASENITFQSTTGSSTNFLKYDLTIATQAESGGSPISGITTDYEGTTRNASAPDMGAWELSGVAADLTRAIHFLYSPAQYALYQRANTDCNHHAMQAESMLPLVPLPSVLQEINRCQYLCRQYVG
jgi:hypothetical protein